MPAEIVSQESPFRLMHFSWWLLRFVCFMDIFSGGRMARCLLGPYTLALGYVEHRHLPMHAHLTLATRNFGFGIWAGPAQPFP